METTMREILKVLMEETTLVTSTKLFTTRIGLSHNSKVNDIATLIICYYVIH